MGCKRALKTLRDAIPLIVYYGSAILVGIVIANLLTGCATTTLPGTPYCNTCIGPYDVTLRSHQEALGIRP